MRVLGSRARQLAGLGVRAHAGENKDVNARHTRVVKDLAQGLRASSKLGIAIYHGNRDNLGWKSDEAKPPVWCPLLALEGCFDDGRMIRANVYEACGNAS